MKKSMLVLFVMLAVSNSAFAAPASPWTKEAGYGNKALHKLGFGAGNLLLGWTALFSEPSKHHEDAKATMKSVGKGMMMASMYTVEGALHVITFPFTNLDIPIPCGGVEL